MPSGEFGPLAVVPFEIIYPGTWLELADRGTAFQAQAVLNTAESCLTDAGLALGGFMASRRIAMPRGREAWEARTVRRQQIELAVRRELNISNHDFDRHDEIALAVDRRMLRERYNAGQLPEGYARRRPFLYAKSFLYAIDGFRDVLVQITKLGISSTVESLISEIDYKLPSLPHVRDSTAHADERVQGMARGKPIALKSVKNRMISVPGGALIVDTLNGDNYGCTLADGSYGEVPVTHESFQLCVEVMQRLLQSLPWKGSPRVAPQ